MFNDTFLKEETVMCPKCGANYFHINLIRKSDFYDMGHNRVSLDTDIYDEYYKCDNCNHEFYEDEVEGIWKEI